MRRQGATALLLLLALIGAAIACWPGPAGAQVGYDRPGGDYLSAPVRSADPAQCAARCERDARCRAWAFSYPVTEHANAMCWLKSRVPSRVAVPCCVSGVRGAGVIQPSQGPIEFGIDRFGGDYRSLELAPDPTGRSCQAACQSDPRCRAWTYARQGYSAQAALCFLKDRITRPQRRPCCISGVVK